MKKILLIIAFLFILAAIPVTLLLVKQRQDLRQRAVPATSLYIDPSSITKNVDDTFDVNVMIDTGANVITAVDLYIEYDETYLEGISIQNGTFLPDILLAGTIGGGQAAISLGSGSGGGETGTGILAVLTFKALKETAVPTEITMTDDSYAGSSVFEDRGLNVIIGKQKGSVTIAAGTGGSNPSPSPSPSATPGSSPDTTITNPADGATISTRRPQISGTSAASADITLSINTASVYARNTQADASGNWSHTVDTDIADGTYTVTVTATLGDYEDVATSSFTISVATGGGAIASPSPSASPQPSASSVGGGASPEPIPVTGTTTPTLMLTIFGILMLILGVSAAFVK